MEYSDKNEHLNDDPLKNKKEVEESTDDLNQESEENVTNVGYLPDIQEIEEEIDALEAEADRDHKIVDVENSTSTEKSSESDPPESTTEVNKKLIDLKDEASPVKSEDSEDGVVEKESDDEKIENGKPAENQNTAGDQEADDTKSVKKKVKAVSVKSEKKNDAVEKNSDKADREEEPEVINYELLSKSDLVKLLEDLINKKPFDQLRYEVDDIQAEYQKKYELEIEEKRKSFLAEGGLEIDFKPIEDPSDKLMSELSEKYKSLKSEYNKQLEELKEVNLIKKQEILEEFRILMEGQEGFDNTFRKFKQLQNRWFEAGIVPKQNVKDLWNSYNYFVDKFNDYVNINRELKAMDLKKNLELKTALCEKAEALANESNVGNAFKTLQKYHAQWREIGPVPREDKDKIWERFKLATSVINKAHQNFQSELKDSLVENLEKKIQLCERVEEIAKLEISSHSTWSEKTKVLLSIQKEWKTIGYAPKKDNNQIYARFRKACDQFFDKKAAFYSETFEVQKENLELKKKIVEEAKSLMDNTDWKKTTDRLISLQKQWKEVGPVPRKDSDRLWKQFRSACDKFFTSKSEFFSGKNESYEDNLKAKMALIKEMKEFNPEAKRKEIIAAMENFQQRYNEIGFVPVEDIDKVRDGFQEAQNEIISKINTDESEKSLIRYRIKVASILSSPKSENKIRFERDKLINKLQQLKSDIGVWENNLGFFKQTESAEGTIADFSVKIDEAKERIENMEAKIRIIDELEDDI